MSLFAFVPLDLNFKNAKPPMKKKKKCLCFFAPCAFWRCSTGFFAFVPSDLNFTNPKSTIFEPGWKTQPFPANHDQITKYNLMFFYKKKKKKNWTDEYCVGTGGKKNGNKILNFPTLSWQPNRITTNWTIKKLKLSP